MSEIKQNSYHDGKVKSLGFTTINGRKATLGVVLPGKFDFGIASAPEEIVVIHNKLTINGKEYRAIMTCQINVNDPIVFEAAEPAAYICYYE